ncbi:MAG: hypothetical protein Q8P62_04590 [Candidatus Peregrinibacteria bacterium]|nr:hypothetical protein [Candidatus Peregrinibacteria bacterium]
MKNKILTSSIALGILIISFSISYYFLKILPAQKQINITISEQEKVQNLREKCNQLGKEKYKEEQKEQESAKIGNFGAPNYIYNKTLDTCLYKNVYFGDSGYRSFYIIDLYTNKTLATNDSLDGKDWKNGLTLPEFLEKENELMNKE